MIRSIALAAAVLAAPATAYAQQGVELGLLDCVVEGGAGFIVGSTKDVSCIYTPADKSIPAEQYFGVIHKYGLDIGVTGATIMQWLVLAQTKDRYDPRALAGEYVGASADASVGVGVGANILVGGTERGFTLQPVSVQAQTGLNLALGVSRFDLRPAN